MCDIAGGRHCVASLGGGIVWHRWGHLLRASSSLGDAALKPRECAKVTSGRLLETAAFHGRIKVNDAWRAHGVKADAFDMYIAILVYESTELGLHNAVRDLRRHLLRGQAPRLTLRDGKSLNLGGAQVMGYGGHSQYLTQPKALVIAQFERILEQPANARGVFALSCYSAKKGFVDALVAPRVHVLGFSNV